MFTFAHRGSLPFPDNARSARMRGQGGDWRFMQCNKVDINTATQDELMILRGIGFGQGRAAMPF
jgi:hypothetical protein